VDIIQNQNALSQNGYGTCGDKNTYTALESATNTVGNAECATASENTDDAQSLKIGFVMTLLLGVVGTMA
jgi:hypothetical protein